MSRVIVYSTSNCAFCVRAKTMLNQWSIAFEDIAIDADEPARQEFNQVTNGARTVPQIVIDGLPIGGFMELMELHRNGDLKDLM